MAGSINHILEAIATNRGKGVAAPPCDGPVVVPGTPHDSSGTGRRGRQAATREGVELKGSRKHMASWCKMFVLCMGSPACCCLIEWGFQTWREV